MIYYLKCDEIARWGRKATALEKIRLGSIWKYNIVLRKLEYIKNCKKGLIKLIMYYIYKFRKRILEHLTGWYIPENVFGSGLCLVHKGPVIVNNNARFGCNVRIQAMVNIGASGGKKDAPHAGDMIYITLGSKLFGNIELRNNVAIGANAVVNKSYKEDNITLAGVPAKIVSYHDCRDYVIDAVDLVNNAY